MRKAFNINDNSEQYFIFENVFDFMDVIENLLRFENHSDDFKRHVALKMTEKILHQIVPLTISSYLDVNSHQKDVIKNKQFITFFFANFFFKFYSRVLDSNGVDFYHWQLFQLF
jgi:hypothetical protein